MKPGSEHTFVILAHKQSPFIEECIHSLLKQNMKSKIIMSTSTPSKFLENISNTFSIPLQVNPVSGSIADDWNFALSIPDTKYVTLAQQDDVYHHEYTEIMTALAESRRDNLITFSNYSEKINGTIINNKPILVIKKLILKTFFPFSDHIAKLKQKKLFLSFGSPIGCPTVMYNQTNIGNFLFSNDFSIGLDWNGWLDLADINGCFSYCKNNLVLHRIHHESETTAGLRERRRQKEDIIIFTRIWGTLTGKILSFLYSFSYGSNKN